VTFVLALITAVSAEFPAEPSPRALIARVITEQPRLHEHKARYAFKERTVTDHLNKDGTIKRTESETYRVLPVPWGEYRRLTSRNGAPLSAREHTEQEEAFDDAAQAEGSRPPAALAEARGEHINKRAERYRERLEDALSVLQFEPLGPTTLADQPVHAFRFAPKNGVKGHSRATKILSRMEGVAWIDADRGQLVRVEVELREDLDFLVGLFGRVAKGSRATAQAGLHDDLWLLEDVDLSIDARLFFLKRYRRNIRVRYDDYELRGLETEDSIERD